MKSKWIIILALALVLIGIYAYYQFYVKPYIPKYEWNTNYLSNNKEPYGLKLFYNTLESSTDNSIKKLNKSITRQLELDRPDKRIYMFIGTKLNATNDEVDHLMKWVYQGNSAFISTDYLSLDLLIELGGYDESEFEDTARAFEGKQIDILFSDSSKSGKLYSFDFKILKEKFVNSWGYFTPYELERIGLNRSVEILSTFNTEYPNFIRFKFGKGMMYLHSNPLVFTNYHFIKEQGFDHAKNILSYLPNGDVYWDDINKTDFSQTNENFDSSQSPLKYILSKNSFRWAWYLLLALLFLFVLFGSKRKQKPIKLVEENKNSSIEYAKAVAALYYQTKNHTYIANEMWRLFTNFVKIKYNIDLKNEKDENVISLLSLKSKISENNIHALIKVKNEVCFNQGKDTVLLKDFQEILTNFYKNCN